LASAYELFIEHRKTLEDIPVSSFINNDELKREYIDGAVAAIELFNQPSVIVFYATAKKGAIFPFHAHPHCTETITISKGQVEIYRQLEGADKPEHLQTLTPGIGGSIEIAPGLQHQLKATEEFEGIVILVPREDIFR